MFVSYIVYEFCSGLLSAEDELISKCEILKPLSFSISTVRNLSFSWHKEQPEVSVDAHLSAVHVTLFFSICCAFFKPCQAVAE